MADCNVHCNQDQHFVEGEAASDDPPHNRLTIHSKHRGIGKGNCLAKREMLLSSGICAAAQSSNQSRMSKVESVNSVSTFDKQPEERVREFLGGQGNLPDRGGLY